MLKLRKAQDTDCDLFFHWASDETVRNHSYHSGAIVYDDHVKWFTAKVKDPNAFLFVFTSEENIAMGQVRIERKASENVIGISIDEKFRGKSLAPVMLNMATEKYFETYPDDKITAYIKTSNEASLKSFSKAGFVMDKIAEVNGSESYIMTKSKL